MDREQAANKRILFYARDLYPARGGGALSMIPLLSAMAGRGLQVTSVNSGPASDSDEDVIHFEHGFAGVVSPRPLQRALETAAGLEPDVLVTQGWGSVEGILLAKELSVPSILFLIDLVQLAPQAHCDYGLDYAANAAVFRSADVVVANSHYTRKRALELANIHCTVIYPVIPEQDFLAPARPRPGFITLVGATPLKGLHMLLSQAERMPLPCLVCGDAANEDIARMDAMDNLTWGGFIPNMSQIYASTACLLVLSQWEETFGRVIVEAHMNGIPVVALDRGAVREVAGKAAVYINDAKELPRAVKRALDIDPELCRANAARFAAQDQIEAFARLLAML